MSNEWERIDAIEEAQGRPWPVLAITLLVVVALALAAWWPKPDADTDALRREETRQLVARAHERMRADSIASVAYGAEREAERYRQRYTAVQRSLTPAVVKDSLEPKITAALPLIRGGWGAVLVDRDTLPTPRVVIGLLRERDGAVALADTTITQQRYALASYRAAIPAYHAALAHGDSALAASSARRVAEVAQVRRSRWRWTWYGLAAGLAAGAVLTH